MFFLMLSTAVLGFVWMSHHRNECFNQEIYSLDLDLGMDSTHAIDPTESQVHLINVTEIVVIYVVPGGMMLSHQGCGVLLVAKRPKK